MQLGIPEILFLILLLEHFITLPKIFTKAGQTGWHGYVPVLQWLTWLKVIQRPWWWVFLLIVPGVNLIMFTILHVETAIVFGLRSTKEQWFAGALPWAFMPKLAFKDEVTYLGARNWKDTKKSFWREWGEAIVFAVVAASVIRTFFMEAFTIPTPSMEGEMLVGDYLFVSKMSYGAKVPQTPLSIPFLHNALPGSLTPSYVEWFSLPHYRLPGFGDVERGDAVVFNFPHGDTVLVKPTLSGYDYYQYLKKEAIFEADNSYETYLTNPEKYLAKARENFYEKNICKIYAAEEKSRGYAATPAIEGIRKRPMDKMDNYVKRCVAVAGDELEIIDRIIHINGQPQQAPEQVQFGYSFQATMGTMDRILKKFPLASSELSPNPDRVRMELGQLKQRDSKAASDYYSKQKIAWSVPLTAEEALAIEKTQGVESFAMDTPPSQPGLMFPYSDAPQYIDWTVDNFGPVKLPAAGETLAITPENIDMYRRTIAVYEGHKVDVRDGKVFIDGQEATSYTFTQNYYWMMGDNRHRSLDSRYWGFVPETHIVGKPVFTWFSKENEAFHGAGRSGVRTDRIFKTVD